MCVGGGGGEGGGGMREADEDQIENEGKVSMVEGVGGRWMGNEGIGYVGFSQLNAPSQK